MLQIFVCVYCQSLLSSKGSTALCSLYDSLTYIPRLSGQTLAVFLGFLPRSDAFKWLAFAYVVIQYPVHDDIMSVYNGILLAERMTLPLDGARIQGAFMNMVFKGQHPATCEWFRQPDVVRFALRPPGEVWDTFRAACIWCLRETKQACSHCHVVRYCGRDCQVLYVLSRHTSSALMLRSVADIGVSLIEQPAGFIP